MAKKTKADKHDGKHDAPKHDTAKREALPHEQPAKEPAHELVGTDEVHDADGHAQAFADAAAEMPEAKASALLDAGDDTRPEAERTTLGGPLMADEPTPVRDAPEAPSPAPDMAWELENKPAASEVIGVALHDANKGEPLSVRAGVVPASTEDQRFCEIVGSTVSVQQNGRCMVCNGAWHQHPKVTR